MDAGAVLDTSLVWLDDVDKHFAGGLDPSTLRRLLVENAGAVIVATIRRSEFQDRQSLLEDPVWELLSDDAQVNRIDLAAELTDSEVVEAKVQFATNHALLAAIDRGVGLGEWVVGGPELIKRLAAADGINRHLVDTVVSWYRTGLKQRMPAYDLRRLWADTLPEALRHRLAAQSIARQDEIFDVACSWACDAIIVRAFNRVALMTKVLDGYEAHDYLVDRAQRQPDRPAISGQIWQCALECATGSEDAVRAERLWRLGIAAYDDQKFKAPAYGRAQLEIAVEAWQRAADVLVLALLPRRCSTRG